MRGRVDREAVLEARARRLAARPGVDLTPQRALEVALVDVAGEVFGIPVDGLREVLRLPEVFPLPGLPAWIPGIAHVRGGLLSVVDLAVWLGLEGAAERAGFLAVLEAPDGPLGLMVGDVLGFRELDLDALTPSRGGGDRPVQGLTPDLISVLDLERLLSHPDLLVS